jgi:DNA-binding MarR family transcriptional regulator
MMMSTHLHFTSFRFFDDNSYQMITDEQIARARDSLQRVMRGLWGRRRPPFGLTPPAEGEPRLGRRHIGLLAQIGVEGERSVGELAHALGLSLPAASKLIRDLEARGLVVRSEDPADRRRTVVTLAPATREGVHSWLDERDRPLRAALDALSEEERAGFLKGLDALANAMLEESAHGPFRSHDRAPHRRRPHRHRPL